jgi:hypothetical protein
MKQKVGNRPDDGAFIHSELDDYGLSQSEFRAYTHILRRAGTGGQCWETFQNAADHILMNRKTYEKAIAVLEKHKMIHVERRKGQSTIITPLSRNNWERPSPAEIKAFAKNGVPQNKPDPTPNGADRTYPKISPTLPQMEPTEPTPNEAGGDPKISPALFGVPQNSQDLPQMKPEVTPNESEPTPNGADKGTPVKFIPLNSSIKDPLSPKGSLSDESEERERGFANAPEEPDAQSTEPELPETKSNPVKNSNPVKDQSSAPRRDPVENARANYNEPPPWRTTWRVGGYNQAFIDFWLARMIERFGPRKRADAIAAIENAEADGKFGKLQAGWDEFEAAELKRQAAEIAAQTIAQPEPPREPLDDAIARLMAGLTPAAVLAEVIPDHRAVFARLPSNPEEAWDCLTIAQKSIIRVHLEKTHATP